MKQLTEEDVHGLLVSLKHLGTRQVVMSGGEAMLNNNFFTFCSILQQAGIRVTLLSTGITLKKNAAQLIKYVDEIIVSLDGNTIMHDTIRNVPGAFSKLKEGIECIRSIRPGYKITGRTVIHKLNYIIWPQIIEIAKQLGLNKISFLPADVSSHAFNRQVAWNADRQQDIMPGIDELPQLKKIIEAVIHNFRPEFNESFIAESPEKLRKIFTYYSALHGLEPFPFKKCNAPWVSTVIEPDGSVLPCFFHPAIGNIRTASLHNILNSNEAKNFRKTLDIDANPTCVKCVCSLNLGPAVSPLSN